MFERRLKIFLGVIVAISLLLLGRVFTVQVMGRSYWSAQAVGLLTRPTYTETTRGRILDVHGNEMAVDTACTDACVDYRAIMEPPDSAWVKEVAISRLRARLGTDYSHAPIQKKLALQADEIKAVNMDIRVMWATLAELNRRDPVANADPQGAIEQKRKEIIDAVNTRRQKVIESNRRHETENASKTSRWLRWLSSVSPDETEADTTAVIAEQEEPHVVLKALDADSCNLLGKHLDNLPGMTLRASTHRSYPMHRIGSNLVGRLAEVSTTEFEKSRHNSTNPLEQYRWQDLIGREGVEALCEPILRGNRGKIEKRIADGAIVSSQDFVPGSDVHLSIDSKLQDQVQQMLQHVEEISYSDEDKRYEPITPEGGVSMHAAAVVLDIATNQVRVLASNPGFDANDLVEKYADLVKDTVDEPLRDRATSDEFEPGSTVKPMLGLGAITQGIIRPMDTIECTGNLYLPEMGPNGQIRRIKMPRGRCWIISEYEGKLKELHLDGSHHPFPSNAPHPTGFLTFADAIERSCDIYFETLADRMTPTSVDHWYEQFGLGRPTGIGIHERPGMRPSQHKGPPPEDPRMDNCWAGMGQGSVWATPLQIANEAATIARGGIWMRPRLLTAETQKQLDDVHPRSDSIPDSVDLHLDPVALEQAREGMKKVVDGPTVNPKIKHSAWLTVAAKTGTADAAKLEDTFVTADGKTIKRLKTPVYRWGAETETPWYRATSHEGAKLEVVHGWYMGYAPADHPQIAFCVLIEYSGCSGGTSAGPVASHLLEACEKAGYLHP